MEGWRWSQMIEEAQAVQEGMYDESSQYLREYIEEHEGEIKTMTVEQLYLFLVEVLN